MQYSPDGRLLLTCGGDGTVKVWSTVEMEVLLTFEGHQSEVLRLCTAGSPHVVASVSAAGELAFWDLRRAQSLAAPLMRTVQ